MKKRKKIVTIVLALVMAAISSIPAFAATSPVINLGTFKNTYVAPSDEWLEDGWDFHPQVIITDSVSREYLALYNYNGTDTEIVIPGKATYNGREYQVMLGSLNTHTGVDKPVFMDNTTIRKITFEAVDGVKVAVESGSGRQLFKGMTALQYIDFNNGIENIDRVEEMFMGDSSLKSVDFTGVEIDGSFSTEDMFNGCTSLTSVNLGNVDFSRVNRTTRMFKDCCSLASIDLTKTSWNSDIDKTGEMFANDNALKEITVGADFNAGKMEKENMFKVTSDTILKIKGHPSETFLNRATEDFKEENRYLGTVELKANVTLSGNTLAKDMFTFKLYKDSVSANNLVKTVKNDAEGNISFGTQKVRETSGKLKYIAVQEAVENITNNSGNLTSEKTITINEDGSLNAE
ncbi:MAG: BspA family leucine-rich repeat surface protein [Lachnospiraceae bacterium]|nr:BspA family leucine-rich repeat surface protein [Lachnospiraceae bacterium]